MACTFATEEGIFLSTLREHIEEAIDDARGGKNLRPLSQIVLRFASKCDPHLTHSDLNDIRSEALLALAKLIAKHQTTPTIANQLQKIVYYKVYDFHRRMCEERKRSAEGDHALILDNHPDGDDVQATIIDQEACDRIVAALEKLRATNERYYEAIRAHLDGTSVAQYLTKLSGIPTSEENGRKILQRARERLSTILTAQAEKAS